MHKDGWNYLITALICASGIMLVHAILPSWVNGFPLTLNFDFSRLYANELQILDARLANPEFARRPVVAFIHGLLNKFMPDQAAFNVIQFTLLTIFFYTLHRIFLSRTVVMFVAISFPIVFAYLGSIHTYDDILQYILVLLALSAVLHDRYIIAWCLVFVGCLVRETTFLLIPVIAYCQYCQLQSQRLYAVASAIIVIVSTATLLFTMSTQDSISFNMTTRFSGWSINFGTYHRISESLILPVLVLGWPLVLMFVHRKAIFERYPIYAKAVIPFVVVNILIVWIAAVSREARLYFLPMLMILPLIAPYIFEDAKRVWHSILHDWKVMMVCLLLSVFIAFVIYQPSTGGVYAHIYMKRKDGLSGS